MELSTVRAFQQALAAQIAELNMETGLDKGAGGTQIGDTLRIVLPVNEGHDAVLTEVVVSSFNEESDYLMFYSTMILEIGPGYEALKEMLLDWNLLCPLGSFGIYRQGRQFYHKLALPFPKDVGAKALADQAMYLLELLYDVISERFPEAVQLSGHG